MVAVPRMVAVVAVLGLAACATSPAQRAGELPPTTRPEWSEASVPVTTMVRPPVATMTPLEFHPVHVDQPCPDSSAASSPRNATPADLAVLEPMLGQVQRYGDQHRGEFGGFGLAWAAGSDASVYAAFTQNLDSHRAALEPFVVAPDRLIVCQAALAVDASAALSAVLAAELAGRYLSLGGGGGGAVEVGLRPGDERLAGQLHERYGDAVDLTVGALAYPPQGGAARCPVTPEPATISGVAISIVVTEIPLAPDEFGQITTSVRLTNAGSSALRFSSGTGIGSILDAAGRTVASGSVVARADLAIPVDLSPGESTDLPVVASVASCDPRLGYVLPAGEYRMVAEVSYADGEVRTLVSEPTRVSIGATRPA